MEKPLGFRTEPARVGECVGKGRGGGGEEELMDVLGLRGEEEFAQFRGQGEGDHEVGRADGFSSSRPTHSAVADLPHCGQER